MILDSEADKQMIWWINFPPKAGHKHAKVRARLARHPRRAFHFTPTSCSWLNAVEGLFAKLTCRKLKHGVFDSFVDSQSAINRFIKEHNQDLRPFVSKSDPNEIIAAVKRGSNVGVKPLDQTPRASSFCTRASRKRAW